MKTIILRLIYLLACCVPAFLSAQISRNATSPINLFNEGKELFRQKNYAAAIPPLKTFVERAASDTTFLVEAGYMLVSSAYELKDPKRIELMDQYLAKNPDSPYSNRIFALTGSAYFFQEKYDEALAMFNSANLELLGNEERDDMTYRKAVSYMSVGSVEQAAVWFETLKRVSSKYAKDCSYYISYIRYTQQRYDEALEGFLPLLNDSKYKSLVPYYVAEIYLLKKQYDKAESVARNYLSAYPNNAQSGEMYRVIGEAYYYQGEYNKALNALENYEKMTAQPKRNVLYMLGISYYQARVFSKAAETLGNVASADDALTQNAYLHMGLAYIELTEKNKARMAFEQAAASNADARIKEQAAYNYALTIHDTSFSAFGESVTVFERFLNDFPNSQYTEKISGYLVDVYLNTRSYEAALKSIERISRPSTKILEAKQKILFRLGTQVFANTEFEKAVDYFNQSTVLGQYDRQTQADVTYWRGEAYYRLGRLHDAARDYSEYLRLNKQVDTEMYALVHYNLGYIAFQKKEYTQARNWFEKYVKLEKTNKETLADAYNRIGDSYFQTRDFNEAKQYYSESESMGASSGDYSFYQLAVVSGLQKDYAGKITLLNRLTGKYPDSPYIVNAIYEKGRSYVLMDNNSQAITAFNELVTKYPNHALSRKAAAETALLYYQSENYDQAIAAYRKVVRDYPGSEEARLAMRDLKSIYIDLNRVDEFANLASSLPGNIHFDAGEQDSLTYIAAEKVYMRGRIEEAKQSFARYLQSFPEGGFSLNANYYLTKIAYEQKNYDQVLHYSAKLLEYPDNQFMEETLVMRGEIQYNMQESGNAAATYKLLKERASTPERRILAKTNILRSVFMMRDNTEIINAATDLLAESKLSPELINEATYYRAKAYLNEKAAEPAMTDLKTLAKDMRTLYGAEAKYLLAQQLYDAGQYANAEKELLNFIEQSTPHAYWLARGFILLSDVYAASGKDLDARQYLLSLRQNYTMNDDIQGMIKTRLEKLKNQ